MPPRTPDPRSWGADPEDIRTESGRWVVFCPKPNISSHHLHLNEDKKSLCSKSDLVAARKKPRSASFTRLAKHRVLEAGAVVDSECQFQYFVTFTFPGSTSEAEACYRENLPWLMNRLNQYIRDEERRRGERFLTFYVKEIGSKGRKKLHLHYCLGSRGRSAFKFVSSLRRKWYALIEELEGKVGKNLFLSYYGKDWRNSLPKEGVDIQSVKKSVAAYLSKYLSKVKKHPGDGQGMPPIKRWWGANKGVRDYMKLSRKEWRFDVKLLRSENGLLINKFESNLISLINSFDILLEKEFNHKFGGGKTNIFYCNEKDLFLLRKEINNYIKIEEGYSITIRRGEDFLLQKEFKNNLIRIKEKILIRNSDEIAREEWYEYLDSKREKTLPQTQTPPHNPPCQLSLLRGSDRCQGRESSSGVAYP
ncbi:rolling circle replication-associated protein [Vibrio sp.]|uniref:rolling circle replication-associated protein n=1 Tax=Vibrio sp. TaxID=678 RepID=UPI003D11ACD6